MNTPSILKQFGSILALGAMLAVTGCSGSGGGGGGASTGTLSLQITDGPVDTAEHVYIQFSGLEIQSADGKRTTLYYCQDPADATKTILKDTACTTPPVPPKQLDLLTLNGGQAEALLNGYTLPSGHYSWIRLMVDTAGIHDSYIVLLGGADHELTIPSGDQTGLKLNRGFDVPAGGSADFTIDFDLRKSVHVTGTGEYMLRPTLRMVDNVMVGAIAGTVDNTLMTVTCDPVNDHPAVYVFEGSGVTPDDIDGIAPDPVTTASVKLDSNDGMYKYMAAFLEAGSYTIAFTCDAAADDPIVDNTLTFSGTTTVTVTANNTMTHNF
jgi:hypothetical protein